MNHEDRIRGCLFGLALGDALGAKTEFLSVAEILRNFGTPDSLSLPGNPARVTDDTQMALAVGEALQAAGRPLNPVTLERTLREAFVAWSRSPENDRAPGNTCLSACSNLEAGLPWLEATIARSKGCGANMRVAPVGLLPGSMGSEAARTRSAIAQFQAALTHGHATALAASDLTAEAIALSLSGTPASKLLAALYAYARSQQTIYHADWLDTLWQQPGMVSPEAFIARGWQECLGILDRLAAALERSDRDADPCDATGEGWIAEEAIGTALLCFLLYPDDPMAAMRRAAVTRGDSDSIACLAGAIAGASLGIDALPQDWVERIEYCDRLEAIAVFFNQFWR